MRVVVPDPPAEITAWLERRRALGQDRFDEVWAGEYHVAPAPHPWHGDVEHQLIAALRPAARRAGLRGLTAFTLGRADDYRIPDHGYVRGATRDTFVPEAAVVVEILSPDDETWRKIDFYHAHGVEEILVVDPRARTVQWLARHDDGFRPAPGSRLMNVSADQLAGLVDWPDVD